MRTFLLLLAICGHVALAQEPAKPSPSGMGDLRFDASLAPWLPPEYAGPAKIDALHRAILIYCHLSGDPNAPNELVGIPRRYRDEEIVEALWEFYRTWRPPPDQPKAEPPPLIIVLENWGAGLGVRGTGVGEVYGARVICYMGSTIASSTMHPTASDQTLANLLAAEMFWKAGRPTKKFYEP